MLDLSSVADAVQANCHRSDAEHAADYTLCVYLLKMREYYRWEQRLALTDSLDGESVGRWLREREFFWEGLEDDGFHAIDIEGKRFDPFDVDGINKHIVPHGFVYSAGYGRGGAVHFVLAELSAREATPYGTVWWLGDELARDLTAPPAMTQGEDIFLRKESFRRMVWEKVQESDWTRCDTAMKRAMRCYGFDEDRNGGLDRLASEQMRLIFRHEQGERRVTQMLGDEWAGLVARCLGGPVELHLRAVRDLWADSLVTLPEILRDGKAGDIHFYMSTLAPNRRALFPALVNAYEQWLLSDDLSGMQQAVRWGSFHWERVALDLLKDDSLTAEYPVDSIKELVAGSIL